MQSVGDQIAVLATNLDRDHIAALQRIDDLEAVADSLKAQKEALASANAVLEKQLADRSDALAAADKQLADALDMVEGVAAAALKMLQVARGIEPAPAKAANNVVPLAPKAPVIKAPPIVPVLLTDEMLKPDFAQQVAGDVMADDNAIQSDSGDETDAVLIGDSDEGHEMVDLTPIKHAIEEKLEAVYIDQAAKLAEAIAEPAPESAVDRMRRGSADLLPVPSLSGPQLVVHNDGGLPIFLQRDTVFQRGDTGQVFM